MISIIILYVENVEFSRNYLFSNPPNGVTLLILPISYVLMTLMLGTNEKLIAKALLSLDTSSILLYQLACINLVDNDCLVITLKPVNSSCPWGKQNQ